MDAELKHGPSGSFEVSVNGKVVSQKGRFGFPSEKDIITAVRQEMSAPSA